MRILNKIFGEDELLITKEKQAQLKQLLYPTEKTEISLLEDLLSVNGDIYFVSGEANYKLYNELENRFRDSLRNGGTIHFLTGPIISIPNSSIISPTDEAGGYVRQEDRINNNIVIRLASLYENFLLYQSEERQPYHYSVSEQEGTTLAFDRHELGSEIYRLWTWKDSNNETKARIKDFKERIKGKHPIRDSFNDYFLFLTDKEIVELRKWTRASGIDHDKISIDNCREFWNKLRRR